MIEAIKNLGDFLKGKEGDIGILKFIDRAKLEKATKTVLFIVFEKKQDRFTYKTIEQYDYQPEKIGKYLYSGGPPNGIDRSPSSLITDNPEKTFKRILRWFEKNKKENGFLETIYSELKKNKEKIIFEIKTKYASLNKEIKKNVLLTLKFIENGTEKYLGDIDLFVNILKRSSSEKYYKLKSIGEAKGNGVCSICGKKDEVYGFVPNSIGFSFSTADKKGFTYYFKQNDFWKNIPVCFNCATSFEKGKRFIDENLNFVFYVYPYYLIPEFVFFQQWEEIYNFIQHFKNKNYTEGLMSREDYFIEICKEKGNIFKLNFLFYKVKGGGKYIDIVKYIESVPPTHLKKIYKTQKEVKNSFLFSEENIKKILGENWVGNFVKGLLNMDKGKDKRFSENNWFFKFLKEFFPNSKTEGIFDKYFIDIAGDILLQKKISKSFLLNFFTKKFQSLFTNKKDYQLKISTLKSLALYIMLKNLKLLKEEEMPEKDFKISHPAKKASFLVGRLINYLFYIQRKERNLNYGEEPFRSRLYSLMLDEKKLKRIFSQAVQKLNEYKKSTPLEKEVSKTLFEAEGKWDISKDEISYYFTLGLCLGESIVEKEEENE